MNIKDAMAYAVNLLGGVNPANMNFVLATINAQTTSLHRLLGIESAAARGDVRQQSFAPSHPCPPPPAEMPNGAILALTAAINRTLFERAQHLYLLPSASRVARLKLCISNLRKEVNIAWAEINAAHELMTSHPPPETHNSAPASAEGAVGPPLTGMRSSHAPPRPVPQQTAASPRVGDTSAEPRAASYIDSLPLDVLAVILEHIDSLRDIEAFCKEYPRADVALSRVHSLSLAGPDKIGPPPKPLTALRALRLAAPLRRDVTSFPIQPLECVTLDQSGAGWTSNNSLHTINALALAAVPTVRLEQANTAAVAYLTTLARPATHLTIRFDGDGINVFILTAGGLVRSFTRVDQAALQYIVQTARADNVAHLELSNWLPNNWAGLLLEDTPASLFSLEVAFGEKPAFNAAHGELQSVLHYGGGAWAWCRHLHHLTLAAAGAGFEVDERDVRAFMASALGREVEVDLRGVRLLGSGVA